MMRDVVFNPLNAKDKSPYGAVQYGESLRLSFRIFRYYDIRKAFIVLNKDGEDEIRYPMSWCELDEGYDRFCGEVKIDSCGLYFFCFEVHSPAGVFRIGTDCTQHARWLSGHKWATTVYKREFQTPEFMKNGVMYQIFVDRFNIGGKPNRAKDYAVYHDNWEELPVFQPNAHGEIVNNDFFGGNLKGITEKLDYLKELNVGVIYLNPIFDAFSNHKYDTGDYARIDADFGTEEDFDVLIAEAKKRGMEIVIDGVFNHTGADSKYFNRYGRYNSVGAYQSKDSPYYEWFTFNDFPKKYEAWWGISSLPAVNENNPSFNNFINGDNGIIEKWMKKGIGGVRLDVVDELPDGFLDNLCKRVKSERADAVVIGEVWENAATKIAYSVRRRYFQGGQLDSVMNYPFKRGIFSFVKHGDANALSDAVLMVCSGYPKECTDVLMNLLGTHDTERAITMLDYRGENLSKAQRASYKIPNERMEQAVKKLKLCAALEYTLPGVPCIYYGDEAGLEGFEDPFCRRTYPWGKENKELISFYKTLGKLRRLPALKEGKVELLHFERGLFFFKRFTDTQTVYVLANSTNNPIEIPLATAATDALTNAPLTPPTVTLPPMDFKIIY